MPDLIPFMETIKSLGYAVKLDTNGNRPDVLKKAVESGTVDYVAMDVKTSLSEYSSLVGPSIRPDLVRQSIEYLKSGAIDYEFRCTLIKEIHSLPVLEDMARLIGRAKQVFLQTFRSAFTLTPSFKDFHAFSE
jgi:pyruvate formate lyase activating enzyme